MEAGVGFAKLGAPLPIWDKLFHVVWRNPSFLEAPLLLAMASWLCEAPKAGVSVGEQSPFSSLPHGGVCVQGPTPTLPRPMQTGQGRLMGPGRPGGPKALVGVKEPASQATQSGPRASPSPHFQGCWSQQEPDHTFPSLYRLLTQMWGMGTRCAEAD